MASPLSLRCFDLCDRFYFQIARKNEVHCCLQRRIFALDQSFSGNIDVKSHLYERVLKLFIRHKFIFYFFDFNFFLFFDQSLLLLKLFDQLLGWLDFVGIFQTVLQDFVDAWLGEIIIFDFLSLLLEFVDLVFFLDGLGDNEISYFEEAVPDGKD